MVTTTVVDGEVIPVENTPPRPPPLPEPPPPSNNFIENNNEDSQQRLHSISSTDGEIILMIKVFVLLVRSMYQIQVREDNDDNDDDDTIADVHEEDETIAIVMQLVALYQVKYKTVPTLFHDAFNNYIQDTNFVNSNILSMTKFCQQHNFVNDKNFADPDDILSMTKFCQQHNFVNDKFFADADDIFYDCRDPNDFIKDIHIDRTSIEPYNDWRTMDDSTTRLIHQGIRDNCATYNIKAGELETALHPIYDIEDSKNSYDNCHATAPEGTTISGELIMSFRLAYQVDRMYCTIAATTPLVFLHQDIHKKDDDDTIAMIMQLVVLFQLKYKMRSFVREDDDTIADVQDSKYNSNLYIDNRCWYSTTPTDEEILLFRLIYRVQVQGQAKYEMIRPIHLICSNDNNNFSTSIDGEKYTSQSKYKDDNTIAIMQLVVLHQDVHEADDTITFMQKALLQDTHINDETIAIMQLVVLYAVVPYHRISYRMKLTSTTEDSSSTDNKKTKDQINLHTATIDIYDNDDTIANMQLVALYHDKDVVHNIDSIFNCPFDIINGNAKFSTIINWQKYTSQDYYIKEYHIKYKTLRPFHLVYHGDETMNDNGNYCNDTRKSGERTTRYSNEDPYMIQYRDIITAIDATYDCNCNDTTITTSITYYCTEQIWMINNNYNNIRFNDGNHCNYIMKKNGEEKRLEEKYQSRALRSEGQYKDEVYNAEEGMFQEPITTKDWSYSNIANIDLNFHNDKMKENGEQTTCYSNQDPCMIIAIDSKDNIDMIATDASLRFGHSNEGKIDINTSFSTIRDETTTLIRTATRTSIGDETNTLTSTDQNGENSEQLDYNLVIVLIYDYVISMILVQLCSCILLIVTMRLLSQSMGSVKIHKDQVLKLI